MFKQKKIWKQDIIIVYSIESLNGKSTCKKHAFLFHQRAADACLIR